MEVDDNGEPVDGTGYLAPVVLEDKCVGCGLCQTRCNVINVREKSLLSDSAIIIEAGEGKEDRLMTGSYIELKQGDAIPPTGSNSDAGYFVPDFPAKAHAPKISDEPPADGSDDDPFGTSQF